MLEAERLRNLIYGNNQQYFKVVEPHYLMLGHMGLGSHRDVRFADDPRVVLDLSE
jgi:hypothetical protein